MALTGQLETDDGIIHLDAYGFAFPLVISTYPTPTAKFDFHIWHNFD